MPAQRPDHLGCQNLHGGPRRLRLPELRVSRLSYGTGKASGELTQITLQELRSDRFAPGQLALQNRTDPLTMAANTLARLPRLLAA